MTKWFCTHGTIEKRRYNLGIGIARFDGRHKNITGFSIMLNFVKWWVDVSYRSKPNAD